MSKTALVTGSSRGIGKACALKLAELGYDIAVNCNSNLEMAQKAVDEITALGRKAVTYKANTADIDEVKDMFRNIQQDFGGIDVLVNNAGVVDDAYLLMIKDESLERSLDINIKGYFNCARQASLKMLRKKSGIIINISSVSSVLAVEGQSVYSATKGAVNAMTHTLAKELAKYGIRVNAVAPGFIETEMMNGIPEELQKKYLEAIPEKRFGTVQDVANIVGQLCSDDLTELEPNVSATGIKNVSVNEPYFAGHFPDTPIMPGVLLIESAAQLCSLVFAPESVEEDKLYVLLKVKDFKMLRPVIPGDTLIISVNVTMSTKSAFEFACVIKVDGEVRAKGSLLFTTMDKNAVYKPSQE